VTESRAIQQAEKADEYIEMSDLAAGGRGMSAPNTDSCPAMTEVMAE